MTMCSINSYCDFVLAKVQFPFIILLAVHYSRLFLASALKLIMELMFEVLRNTAIIPYLCP